MHALEFSYGDFSFPGHHSDELIACRNHYSTYKLSNSVTCRAEKKFKPKGQMSDYSPKRTMKRSNEEAQVSCNTPITLY